MVRNIISESNALELGWVEFISRYEPYHWYGTLTFQKQIHPEQAISRFLMFIRRINEELYGKGYRKKGLSVSWVYVIENQKRKVIHFHFLIGGDVRILNKFKYMRLWEKNFKHDQNDSTNSTNGFARIYDYDPDLGAKYYLAKSIKYGSVIDFYFPRSSESQLVIEEVIRTQ